MVRVSLLCFFALFSGALARNDINHYDIVTSETEDAEILAFTTTTTTPHPDLSSSALSRATIDFFRYMSSIHSIPLNGNNGLSDHLSAINRHFTTFRFKRNARRRRPQKARNQRRPITLKQALQLIESQKMDVCVTRVLCELACDPNGHGPTGQMLHQALVRLEANNPHSDDPLIVKFQSAVDKGRELKGRCRQCYSVYTSCPQKTEQLLKLASQFNVQ